VKSQKKTTKVTTKTKASPTKKKPVVDIVPEKNTEEILEFKEIKEDSSDEEKLEAHQHNIKLVHRQQEFLIRTTSLDATDELLVPAVCRIILIDRKIVAIGSVINGLVAKIAVAKEDKENSVEI